MMPSCNRKEGNNATTSKIKEIVTNKEKLKKKLKCDKTVLEKRIAEQTKEFECDRRLTEKRLKKWIDPTNCGAFERRLKRLTEREAKALENRVSSKLKSIRRERWYLQTRLGCFRKGNLEDCIQDNEDKIRDLLKDLQCDPDAKSSKKKHRIPCGVG